MKTAKMANKWHTHIHTQIYIYIFLESGRERERETCLFLSCLVCLLEELFNVGSSTGTVQVVHVHVSKRSDQMFVLSM